MFAHLVGELDVVLIDSEVDDWTVTTDVKDCVVSGRVHICELLCAGKLGFDRLILEETDTLVIGEALHRRHELRVVGSRSSGPNAPERCAGRRVGWGL